MAATLFLDAATSWTSASAAAGTLLVALILAVLVARAMSLAERRLEARPGGLDAAGHTRLRFLRRLAFAGIVVAGLFIALLEFDSFDRLASAAIASGALLSAIIGFAARDSLGNAVSGVTLAITQPIRVGDVIQVGDVRGTVEDVTLTTTWLRTPDEGRVILPNTLITTSPVRNDSIRGADIVPAAMLWIAADNDIAAALAALEQAQGVRDAGVEEVSPAGIRLRAGGDPVPAGERVAAEGALREQALRSLRAAGVRGADAG